MPRRAWILATLSVALLLSVMGWVTAQVLRLQHERAQAEAHARLEERVRLALWRLDSTIAPLISHEVGVLSLGADVHQERPPGILARFRYPLGGELEISTVAEHDRDRLRAMLEAWGSARWLVARAQPSSGSYNNPGAAEARGGAWTGSEGANEPLAADGAQQEQLARNALELERRKGAIRGSVEAWGGTQHSQNLGYAAPEHGPGPGPSGPTEPHWLGEDLVLLRTLRTADGGDVLLGSWIEWPRVRERLQGEIVDLLPGAQLEPLRGEAAATGDRVLATLPVRLVPGAIAAEGARDLLGGPLAMAWLGVVVACAAVLVLLQRSLALSDRRAAFVSTVTHELRTPLTTFKMYTEMLDEDLVAPDKRAKYTTTLRREADRLATLVDNVLAYARLESDGTPARREAIPVADLLDRVRERLHERARAAGVELVIGATDLAVWADPLAFEQILFNLVDNACKYGVRDGAGRIDVTSEPRGSEVAIVVRDRGPGIEVGDRRRVFEPFAKARADAAGTKPGVGLGLALARTLARRGGGDLRLREGGPPPQGSGGPPPHGSGGPPPHGSGGPPPQGYGGPPPPGYGGPGAAFELLLPAAT
jgi:signal transduction histidine kinase